MNGYKAFLYRAIKPSRSLEFERKRATLFHLRMVLRVPLVRLTDVQNQSFRNVSHWFVRAWLGGEGREGGCIVQLRQQTKEKCSLGRDLVVFRNVVRIPGGPTGPQSPSPREYSPDKIFLTRARARAQSCLRKGRCPRKGTRHLTLLVVFFHRPLYLPAGGLPPSWHQPRVEDSDPTNEFIAPDSPALVDFKVANWRHLSPPLS